MIFHTKILAKKSLLFNLRRSDYFANFFSLDDRRFNFKLFADPTDEAFVFEDKLLCLLGLFFTDL